MKKRKLVVTPLDESKQINQVLANDTARNVLDVVSDESLSSSQISKRLGIPLTTVEYNVKRLQEVGLIKVGKKKWSKKGRVVKFYVPQEKFIILVPKMKRAQVIQTLRKMLPFVGLLALIGTAIEFIFTPVMRAKATSFYATQATLGEIPVDIMEPATEGVTSGISKAAGDGVVTGLMQAEPHYGLWFFIIAMLVLLVIISFNYYYKKVKK